MPAALGSINPARTERQGPADDAETSAIAADVVLPAVPPAPRRGRIAFKIATASSALVHASVLLAFIGWLQDPEAGAIPEPSEAVSVEMVVSATLETLQPKQDSEPAPSPEATAPVEGKTEASEVSVSRAEPPPEPQPEPEPVEPAPATVPDAEEEASRAIQQGEPTETPAPPPPVDAPTEVVREPPKAKVPDKEDIQARRKQVEKVERKTRVRSRKGGTISRTREGRGRGSSRTSASHGAISRYKDVVRARVAANRPSSECTPGATVVVNFAVTPSGGLAHVRVIRSSGDPAYRQQATTSVRRAAPFPRPPPGATYLQRLFTIPFYCN